MFSPRKVNPIRKAKYKKSRLRGKSVKQSLLDAGYAKSSAQSCNSNMAVVKLCDDEIARSFKLIELTPEKVLSEIEALQARAIKEGDNATVTKLLDMKGRYLAMFTDKKQIETKDLTDYGKAFTDELMRADPRRKFKDSLKDSTQVPTITDNDNK